MRFVDTNIAIYSTSPLPEDSIKQRVSVELLSQDPGNLAVSVQVLGEFYYQITRPSRRGLLSHDEAVDVIEDLQRHHVQDLSVETLRLALLYRERFGLNYWDCLILAAAKQSGCEAVYSEDMSATQDYDGIRVINPFEAAGEPALV